MKHAKELNDRKAAVVLVDRSLDKYSNKTPFPDKLEKANKMLKTAKLPPRKSAS